MKETHREVVEDATTKAVKIGGADPNHISPPVDFGATDDRSETAEDNLDRELDEKEQEDETNTIGSGKTTTATKKDLDKVVMPKFVRYQLMITPINQIDKNEEEDGVKTQTPTSKIRDIFIK